MNVSCTRSSTSASFRGRTTISTQVIDIVQCLRVKDHCRRGVSAEMPRCDFHKAGSFRRCATVFKISRESSSSDTARAMPMAPTSAQYVMIARDLAVPLPLPFVPRIRVASNSMLFRIFWVTTARVRLLVRARSGAKAPTAQPTPG